MAVELGTAGSYVLVCRNCRHVHFRQNPNEQYCVWACGSREPLEHLDTTENGRIEGGVFMPGAEPAEEYASRQRGRRK